MRIRSGYVTMFIDAYLRPRLSPKKDGRKSWLRNLCWCIALKEFAIVICQVSGDICIWIWLGTTFDMVSNYESRVTQVCGCLYCTFFGKCTVMQKLRDRDVIWKCDADLCVNTVILCTYRNKSWRYEDVTIIQINRYKSRRYESSEVRGVAATKFESSIFRTNGSLTSLAFLVKCVTRINCVYCLRCIKDLIPKKHFSLVDFSVRWTLAAYITLLRCYIKFDSKGSRFKNRSERTYYSDMQ